MMRARWIKSNGHVEGAGRRWGHIAAVCVALLAGLLPLSRAETTRTLQSVNFVELDGSRVQLTLTLSDVPPQPVVFTVDKPARLAMDLPDTHLGVADRYGRINIGDVRGYAVAEAKGRTRLVVDLVRPVSNQVAVEGNKIVLTLDAGTAAAQAAGAPATAAAGAGAAIGNLDFRRGENGEGRVIVTLSDPHTPVDVQEEGGKIIAKFKNTQLPDRLARRLDVLDFATPVKYVDAIRDGNDTDVVVTPIASRDFEQVAYQTGDVFTVELQPLTPEKVEERKKAEPQYTGERISLSFQNVDVRSLLQIIADVAGTNMVVSDSVNGNLAMRLQNVPWDQALDIILRTKGLGMRHEGNVMLVAPLEELAQRAKAEAEADKAKVQVAQLHSEIVQVNYAKASDIAALLKSGENSVLSERGRVSVDDRTNTLLILESREKLADIRDLIQRLDVPVRQVLIESRIVIAKDNYERDLGTRFGVTRFAGVGNDMLATTGNGTGADTMTGSFLNNLIDKDPTNDGQYTLPTLGNRYNVNLPTANIPAGSIGLALLGKDFLVDLELQAYQSEGKGEVISSPRVITANAKQATIEQGVEIPYQESTSSGATSVSFKKAVLSLDVTPQITPDQRIIMDLIINKDSVGVNVPTGSGGSVPSIDTRKVKTQVLVDNGQTVVLGGIYERTDNDTVTKVPLLGDIPLLGHLFRSTIHQNNKTELLIFITPKLLSQGLQVSSD
jgi:type IV pilus assembly protein PilQ